MLSLRDKLRATHSIVQKPAKPASNGCYIRETRYSADLFPAGTSLPASTLKIMQGINVDQDIARDKILFLDTETTGLSGGAGTVAFLAGVGFFEEGSFVIRQFLMRDYDEEIYILSAVAQHLNRSNLLVTFNGSTFDMPLLESRFIMQRIQESFHVPTHADLMHTSRRVWKLRIKRCSLSSLEEQIFGQGRVNDLPGAEVPERYFQYLKTKDFSLLEDILAHNINDIFSLMRLLKRLSTLHEEPVIAGYPEDIFSLGRIYEMRGMHEGARICYRASDQGKLSALSREYLADNLRRNKNYAQAAALYEKMIRQGQGNAQIYIALSKLYEHRLYDHQSALDAAIKGMQYCMDRADIGNLDAHAFSDLKNRNRRLLLKQGGLEHGIHAKSKNTIRHNQTAEREY